MIPGFVKAWWKNFFDQFISLRGAPEHIALSLAIGIFVGVTPTIPFHTVIILVLVLLFRRNFTAAWLGSWLVSNPLTIPVFYLSQYHLGKRLLGMNSMEVVFSDYSFYTILHMGKSVMAPLLLGGVAMAPFLALGGYILAVRSLRLIRKQEQP